MSSTYKISVIKEGYSFMTETGSMRACGSVTLVYGKFNVLVDTGGPWDTESIIEGLRKHGLTPDEMHYVVGTHGHSDHIGNLNLFKKATQIVGYDICQGDNYLMHDFRHQDIPFEIDDDLVQVIPTPGHTESCVSVVVKDTNLGTVVVAGDLFEKKEDLEEPELWQSSSTNPDLQLQNRIEILRMADVIVPGHGPMFQVPDAHKRSSSFVMYADQDELI
ncbi:metallo-beta-lactamase domain-containing protein 1-like isoform X2 [Tubulanus polymorphus]